MSADFHAESRNGHAKDIVPETHELVRDEDIEEALEHLADSTNPALPRFGEEHIAWARVALLERKDLCARQYRSDGRLDEEVTRRLKELEGQLDGVSPLILKVLHYLSRIRAIIPALIRLRKEMKQEETDPTQKMIREMKYQCSKAEVEAAIKGLAELHIRPRILDEMGG